MGIFNSFLVQHFTEAIWAIKPDKLRTMTEVVLAKAEGKDFKSLLQLEDKEESKRMYVQRRGNIAVLNIEGVLVPKCSWLDSICGFVSTLELHTIFNSLVDDPTVERIVLYFDSPGGATIGIPEFATSIYEARQSKEIVTFTDTEMCSAAYWLGSAADIVVATPSAIIGSIGVYYTLIKMKSRTDEYTGDGYDVHFISAGEKKLFGSPDIPLTEDEVAYFNGKVTEHYERFTATMAEYRGTEQAEVKETQAAFYDAINAPDWMVDQLGDVNFILS